MTPEHIKVAARQLQEAEITIDEFLELIQAREQQLLDELLDELPDKKDFQMAVRAGSAMWGAQIDAHNEAIDQVITLIQSKLKDGEG